MISSVLNQLLNVIHFMLALKIGGTLSLFARNHRVLQEPAQLVTRFLSLANVGNATKKKVIKLHIIL